MVRSAKKAENEEKLLEQGGSGGSSETQERNRLKQLAFTNKLLSNAASKPFSPLNPSKTIIKNDGRDVVKKGHRKNRFLFAFPGLLAPISGGKIGELVDLGTKNPVLYIDFPQGRMKLFGTIIYPKNKYLTLQFSKTSKNVLCEDSFENMVVFSDVWWIGTKAENPEEIRLEFPKELDEGKHADYDFKGGVGATSEEKVSINISGKEYVEPVSPEPESMIDVSEDSGPLAGKESNAAMVETPVRHSTRTAGKKFKFLESSSGDDIGSDSDVDLSGSGHKPKKMEEKISAEVDDGKLEKYTNPKLESPSCLATENEIVKTRTPLRSQTRQASVSAEKSKGSPLKKKGGLVQTTLSNLFGKVEEKNSTSDKTSPAAKGSSKKRKTTSSKPPSKRTKVEEASNKHTPTKEKKGALLDFLQNAGKQIKKARKPSKVEDEDIEEISSESQASDDSDVDWAA